MARKLSVLQAQLTAGELDPKLAARRDLKHYYEGGERARNVFPLPQGGWRRRDGTLFIHDASLTATAATPAAGHRWIPFEFSTEDEYMLLFLDGEFRVFKDSGTGWAHVHTETGLPYSGQECIELDYTQELETLIITHRDHNPKEIQRTDDTTWTVDDIVFTKIPQHNFAPSVVQPNTAIQSDGETGFVKLTLSAGPDTWLPATLNQHVIMNGGEAKITQINSPTVAVAAVIFPFYNTDLQAAGTWDFEQGWEDAWSGARGWPAAVAFYEGRVFYGGGLLADNVWGSRVGSFEDFEEVLGLDDEPISFVLAQDEVNAITRLAGGQELTAYTTGGVFTVPQEEGKPLTPQNSAPKRRIKRGAQPNVNVPEIDGAIFFIQKGGKTIREMVFDEIQQGFVAEPLSLLSGHLLNGPVDLSVREATSTEDADLVLSAQSDGTLVTDTLLRSQQVNAWASHSTEGKFLGAGVVSEAVFLLVERVIDGNTVYYVELFDDTLRVDCAAKITTGLPTDTFTVAHLPNTLVHVRADDAYMGTFLTNGAGTFTLPRQATTLVEIGFNFPTFTDPKTKAVIPTPLVRTMPLEVPLPDGTLLGRKKRVVEVTMELENTTGLEINGNPVPFRTFGPAGGGSPLDQAIVPFTGTKTVEGLLEYDEKGQIEITQPLPLDMTVLGFAMKVSV